MAARMQVVAAILVWLAAGHAQEQKSPPPPAPQASQAPAASTAAPAQPAPQNPPCPQAPQVMHSISGTFDYDFTKTPACKAKKQQNCVAQFVLYDVSIGVPKRKQLVVIPLPANPKGAVKKIPWSTGCLVFESGKHRLAVRAQEPNGQESHVKQCESCTTIVEIP